MDQSTFEQFEVNVAHARTQLVWRRIPADLETPVSAYLKLAQGQDYAFLLESVEGGATLGRYSAIGLDPDFIWQGQAGDKNTLEELRAQVAACKIDDVPDHIPPMGPSGLFGYMS
jgi:anthranilate synthase component 1